MRLHALRLEGAAQEHAALRLPFNQRFGSEHPSRPLSRLPLSRGQEQGRSKTTDGSLSTRGAIKFLSGDG